MRIASKTDRMVRISTPWYATILDTRIGRWVIVNDLRDEQPIYPSDSAGGARQPTGHCFEFSSGSFLSGIETDRTTG